MQQQQHQHKEKLLLRTKSIQKLRHWFAQQQFQEVETPTLSRFGEQNEHLEQFSAKSDAGESYILNSSPEYDMKKLLAEGYPKIFQICKSYRANEPGSALHQPEFTILEWYRANSAWEQIADDLENICRELVPIDGVHENTKKLIQKTWRRRTMYELFKDYANIDLEAAIKNHAILQQYCDEHYNTTTVSEFEENFNLIFLNEIERHLGKQQPDIVSHFPAELAALATKDPSNPNFALRFELYINGVEIANAFQELTDPKEQLLRFQQTQQWRRQHKKRTNPIDTEFIQALEYGIPPSAGIALGVDRLVMILAGANDIRDVLWFSK